MENTGAWKQLRFILLDRYDFHMTDCTITVAKRIWSLLWPRRGVCWRIQETMVNYPKRYRVLQYVGRRRKKDIEYVTWDDSINLTKISNIYSLEKSNRQMPWILVKGSFWSTPPHKMGTVHFQSLYVSRLLFNCISLPYHGRFLLFGTCLHDLRTSSFL